MMRITRRYLFRQMFRKLGLLGSMKIGYWTVLRKIKKNKTYIGSIYIKKIGQRLYLRPLDSDFTLLVDFFIKESEKGTEHYDIKRITEDKDIEYIIDAGANIGFFSVLYGAKYSYAKIIAIEPDEDNFALLKKNTAWNRNIIPILGGVWYRDSLLRIENPDDRSWSFRVIEVEDEQNAIKGHTIDSLMRKYSFPRLDVLKMDIEGTEYSLFKDVGYRKWIKNVKFVICELHENLRGGVSELVTNALTQEGFMHETDGEDVIFWREGE